MKPIMKTLEEAMRFFILNSNGNCICQKESGEELEVNCYPQAVEFFNN